MKALSLQGLLAPIELDEFLSNYAFKQPLLVSGSFDKFAALFTWDSLNRILSYTRHNSVRVHLERVGATEAELEFTRQVSNIRGELISRIDVTQLYRRLKDGATLVVDAVNEVDRAVANLSENVAAFLSASRATTVLFASFGRVPGFSVHWDSRDVYALQVEGEKYWRIFSPSHAAPLNRGDLHQPGSGVPGPLFWEGTLQRGDMLYIPRGWWHEVTAGDSPTLHLNLGFSPVTAIDFLKWFTDTLRENELMRLDIPRFGTTEEVEEYQDMIKQEISFQLAALKITDFLASARSGDLGQTYISLPMGVDGKKFLPGTEQLVRLTNLMSESEIQNGTYILRAGGKEIAVLDSAAPVIERLMTNEAVSIAELANTAPDISLDDVRSIVATLISDGVVHTVV